MSKPKIAETHEQKIEQSIVRSVKTCKPDVRSFLIDRLKDWKKPWEAMTESEQRSQIAAADAAAENLIRNIAEIIAAEGRTALVGKLDKVAVKDGYQATIKLGAKDENRHALVDAVGLAVLIVVKGVEEMLEEDEADKTKPEPDQGDLVSAISEKWALPKEDVKKAVKGAPKTVGEMRVVSDKIDKKKSADLTQGFNDD